jgi:CRP/FNR family cyclic AMP-dependent transcriptional regulator
VRTTLNSVGRNSALDPGLHLTATMSRTETEDAAGIMLVESESLVRRIPGVLDSLGESDRKRLLSIGRKRTFEPEEVLWRQGDLHEGIYLVNSGRIRSFYLAPSGREVTLAYWFAGNFVGGPDLFGGSPHVWSSSAVQRSDTIFLPGPALRKVSMESAPIAVALLDALSFKAKCYCAMAQMMGTRSAADRLQRLLVFLATVYGLKGDDGILVAASFTHAELAALIGSTRQWVTIQFAKLQRRGVLRYNRGIILVLNLRALEESDDA